MLGMTAISQAPISSRASAVTKTVTSVSSATSITNVVSDTSPNFTSVSITASVTTLGKTSVIGISNVLGSLSEGAIIAVISQQGSGVSGSTSITNVDKTLVTGLSYVVSNSSITSTDVIGSDNESLHPVLGSLSTISPTSDLVFGVTGVEAVSSLGNILAGTSLGLSSVISVLSVSDIAIIISQTMSGTILNSIVTMDGHVVELSIPPLLILATAGGLNLTTHKLYGVEAYGTVSDLRPWNININQFDVIAKVGTKVSKIELTDRGRGNIVITTDRRANPRVKLHRK